METINANAAFLCNYEVMQILQKLKDNTQRKHKREASLATVTYETVHYLQNTECKNQSEESIRKCLEAMKCFKLTKSEKLMMLNTPPRTELEIQLIVQESEERLSEEEVKKIIAIVNEFLPASTYLLHKKILIVIRNSWLLAHVSSNNTTEFNKTMSKVPHLSRLLLYKRDASPPSCAVMMLGDILGLQFDYREPDLGQLEQHSSEFKKISPMSTIPVLQDGDLTICESHAILKYLIRKYGGEKREMLYPSDLQTRAIIDQLMFYDAGVFFARLKSIALPTLQQGLSRASERHVAYIEETSSVLEAHLKNHSYIAADHLTVADLSVGTTTMAMQSLHKLDGNRFPLSTQWLTRFKEECFKKNYDFSLNALSKMLNINK